MNCGENVARANFFNTNMWQQWLVNMLLELTFLTRLCDNSDWERESKSKDPMILQASVYKGYYHSNICC